MTAIRVGNATELWHDLVREGEQRRRLALGEDLQAYLVFALMRNLGDRGLLGRILALEWLHAQTPPLRPDRLRDVGDRCLLIAGMFPEYAQRCQVGTGYYVDLGRGAYANAATRAPRCERGLFGSLAEAFLSLVDVLAAVRGESLVQALAAPAQTREVRALH